jgi:hypothetical protein
MPFTKAEILAMPSNVVDEYVAESVLQWGRALTAEVINSDGQIKASIAQAWAENKGGAQGTRADASTFTGPQYRLLPVADTPRFAVDPWPLRIVAKMAARGYTLELKASGGNAAAVFYTGTRPPTPDYVVLPDAGDAVRRAALVAVQ